MVAKTVLIALMMAYVEARFNQEQVPIDAISQVQGGEPGAAATIAGGAVSDLLGAANACDKLATADQIVADLGGGADAIAAAIGMVTAEKNTDPSKNGNAQNVCADPTLPATQELRGITPLIDPDVDADGAAAALSEQTAATPLDATDKSVFDLMVENGLEGVVVAQDAAGGAGADAGANAGNQDNAGDADAGNDNAGDANAGDANAGDANAGDANAGNEGEANQGQQQDQGNNDNNANQQQGQGKQNQAQANQGDQAQANQGNQAQGKAKGKKNKGQNQNNNNANQGQDAAAGEANADAGNANAENQNQNQNQNQGQGNNTGNAADDNANAGNDNAANADAGNADAGNNAGGAAAGDLAGADFGQCTPTLIFEGGLGGRSADEFTFQMSDPLAAEGQQEALNPVIIANRLCDQLGNVCEANEAAIAACEAAKADMEAAGTRDKQTADDFNAALGFAGAVTNPSGGPEEPPADAAAARLRSRKVAISFRG